MTASEIIPLALMLWTDLMLTVVFVLQWRRDREDRKMAGDDAGFHGYSKESHEETRRVYRLPPRSREDGEP